MMSTDILERPALYVSDIVGDDEAPAVVSGGSRDDTYAFVAVFALVAAFLGVGLAVVIYICSVCSARSFASCVYAVENYWTRGC